MTDERTTNETAESPVGKKPLRAGLLAPASILLFIALVFTGAYFVRKNLLERAMISAMEVDDGQTVISLSNFWPSPLRAEDAWGRTPLGWAAENGELAVLRYLLANGRNLNDAAGPVGQTPLHLAVRRSQAETVQDLISLGADVNVTDEAAETPLSSIPGASIMGNRPDPRIARLLIDAGAQVNGADPNGRTPLHNAALNGMTEFADCLIRRGAKVNARDRSGSTPLHQAVTNDKTDMAELLLRDGADMTARDDCGRTPLHLATSKPSAMELLIDKGAEVDARNNDGETPLHYAVWGARPAAVELLVERGADVNARSNAGRTPLAIVRGYQCLRPEEKMFQARIADLLVQHGAKE